MNIIEAQDLVRRRYEERGYISLGVMTLALGVCEEAGEVAKSVNAFYNPEYKLSPGRHPDSLEHELCDLLVYMLGLANAAGIDLDKSMQETLSGATRT